MPKTEYTKIDAIPTSKRGLKQIPQEWVKEVQAIPEGSALRQTDLKASTVQGRIRNLILAKTISENFKVITRTIDKKKLVWVAHEKPTE